jgi:hypothetical protein
MRTTESVYTTSLRTHWGRKVAFEEVCTCGATSGPMPNPGFCSGWSVEHREQVHGQRVGG